MLSVKFDTAGLTTQIDKLREVVQGAVRPAAQAGAQVYYDEMKLRAGAIKNSGTLAASIFQKYVKENSLDGYNATYHISWNKGKGKATPTAFHGQLIEYGWIQRYASYLDKQGNWHTAVRPDKQGSPKPKGRASQAAKDAYYVLRKAPIQHAPRSFLRATYDAKNAEALAAAEQEMQDRILKAFI